MASSIAMERFFCDFVLLYNRIENGKNVFYLVGNKGKAKDLCWLISCTLVGDYFQQLGQLYADKLIDFWSCFHNAFDFEHITNWSSMMIMMVCWCEHNAKWNEEKNVLNSWWSSTMCTQNSCTQLKTLCEASFHTEFWTENKIN